MKRVSTKTARRVGKALGIKFSHKGTKRRPSLVDFRRGMQVELEHGTIGGRSTNVTNDDPVSTGRIALAHLRERPDYYRLLEKYVEKARANPCVSLARRGVWCLSVVRILGYYVVVLTKNGDTHASFRYKTAASAAKRYAQIKKELRIR